MVSDDMFTSDAAVFFCAENTEAVVAPLLDGETFARRILESRWFREFSVIKSKAVLDAAGFAMLKKHALTRDSTINGNGKESGSGKERESKGVVTIDDNCGGAADDVGRRRSVVVAGSRQASVSRELFKQQRRQSEYLCSERAERDEIEREEMCEICQLRLIMEEDLMRVTLVEEFTARLQLIYDVMKPKVMWRYIFAWGIVTATARPPVWREKERIRCSQRHKPAHLRSREITCRSPFMSTSASCCGNTNTATLALGDRSSFCLPPRLLQLRSDV